MCIVIVSFWKQLKNNLYGCDNLGLQIKVMGEGDGC